MAPIPTGKYYVPSMRKNPSTARNIVANCGNLLDRYPETFYVSDLQRCFREFELPAFLSVLDFTSSSVLLARLKGSRRHK